MSSYEERARAIREQPPEGYTELEAGGVAYNGAELAIPATAERARVVYDGMVNNLSNPLLPQRFIDTACANLALLERLGLRNEGSYSIVNEAATIAVTSRSDFPGARPFSMSDLELLALTAGKVYYDKALSDTLKMASTPGSIQASYYKAARELAQVRAHHKCLQS